MRKIFIFIAAVALAFGSAAAQFSKELEKKAKGGDIEAMVAVGDAYLKGDGVAKDPKKAKDWYNKAIKKGSDIAYIRMADLYSSWDALGKEPSEVREWFRKAYNESMPMASLEYARRIIRGDQGFEDLSPKPSDENIDAARERLIKNGGEKFAQEMMNEYPYLANDLNAYIENVLPRYFAAMDILDTEAIESASPILMANGVISTPLRYIEKYEKENGSKTPAMKKIVDIAMKMRKHKASTAKVGSIKAMLQKMSDFRTDVSELPRNVTTAEKEKYLGKRKGRGTCAELCRAVGYDKWAQNDDIESMFIYALSYISDKQYGKALYWADCIRLVGGYEPFPAALVLAIYRYMGEEERAMLFMDDFIKDDPYNIIHFVGNDQSYLFITKSWLDDFQFHRVRNSVGFFEPTDLYPMEDMLRKVNVATRSDIVGWISDAKRNATGSARTALSNVERAWR